MLDSRQSLLASLRIICSVVLDQNFWKLLANLSSYSRFVLYIVFKSKIFYGEKTIGTWSNSKPIKSCIEVAWLMLDLSFPCLIAASRQMWHFRTPPKQQPCSFQLQTHVHFLTHALRSFFPSLCLSFFSSERSFSVSQGHLWLISG